jgi:hypothetical protein
LICCGWAYGSTLTLLRLCSTGVDFRKIELFFLVGGKTHCTLIAARASDVSTWEIWWGNLHSFPL